MLINEKWAAALAYPLGIAKHPYIRTDGQPTNMSCPLCLVYTFGGIGDFNGYKALPYFVKVVSFVIFTNREAMYKAFLINSINLKLNYYEIVPQHKSGYGKIFWH